MPRYFDAEYARRWRLNNPELLAAQRRRYNTKHKEEMRRKTKEYRAANKILISTMRRATYLKYHDKNLAAARNRRKVLKSIVLAKYGGKCVCPGCTQKRPEFLTVDHPNNDGKEDRLTLQGSITLYRRLAKTIRSSRYRLMCYNCNCGRSANGGNCPYEGKRH